MIEVLDWIEAEIQPRKCNSTELIYDHQVSQSDFRLPYIYKEFDITKRSHWIDRGYILDFLISMRTGRILDFGPGDGWPSLSMAPYVEHVTLADASQKRVAVCVENAERLSINNCDFVHINPDKPLPFEDESFDGVTAASSIEQSPDPSETLLELFRILKKGGSLRMTYEGLEQYRGGKETELEIYESGSERSMILIYDRRIDDETVDWYCIDIESSADEIARQIGKPSDEIAFTDFAPAHLLLLRDKIIDARVCRLTHPSGRSWIRLLIEAGFSQVRPSRSGGDAAAMLFDYTEQSDRPNSLTELDKLLRPAVKRAIFSSANPDRDPMITEVK